MSDLDKFIEDYGFKTPFFETWSPEDYGFVAQKITDQISRGIYYKGDFELRKLKHDYWLCRRKTINERKNTEYLQRFYLKILPEEKEIAGWLLVNGLR